MILFHSFFLKIYFLLKYHGLFLLLSPPLSLSPFPIDGFSPFFDRLCTSYSLVALAFFLALVLTLEGGENLKTEGTCRKK